VIVKKWDGQEWSAVGGPLNTTPDTRATKPCLIASKEGKSVYVGLIERKVAGTVHGNDQVVVKRLSGSSWTTVGPESLNVFGEKGNAWGPSLALIGSDLWVAWCEYQPHREFKNDAVLYDRPQVFVARWDGKSWRREGSLNADPVDGSAAYVSVAAVKGKPVVAWAEAKGIAGPRQLFARVRR
jgi:hypothetical protein